MSDIVERLRKEAPRHYDYPNSASYFGLPKLLLDAADALQAKDAEIERLRAELDERADEHSDRAVALHKAKAEIERLRAVRKLNSTKPPLRRQTMSDHNKYYQADYREYVRACCEALESDDSRQTAESGQTDADRREQNTDCSCNAKLQAVVDAARDFVNNHMDHDDAMRIFDALAALDTVDEKGQT